MIQKITEVKAPKVGRFYLVPCVYRNGMWWPVVGPWHVDPEINFDRAHYHYDPRFFLKRQCGQDRIEKELVRVFAPLEGLQPTVEWHKRKMFREMPDFPKTGYELGLMGDPTEKKNHVVEILEKAFADVQMKCMTCPHRGMPLQGLPVKDGKVVCNGHGLQWDIETGRMVPR